MLDKLDLSAVVANPAYGKMWRAILTRCDEIEKATPNRGVSRGVAMISADGWAVSSLLGLYMHDGTTRVWEVSARITGRRGIVTGEDGPWTDSRDAFWEKELADRSAAVVIAGEHYRIRPDLPERDRDRAGFAGALHRIRHLADGRVTETRNLWHGGTVPPKFRGRLPDDAEFISAEVAKALTGEES